MNTILITILYSIRKGAACDWMKLISYDNHSPRGLWQLMMFCLISGKVPGLDMV